MAFPNALFPSRALRLLLVLAATAAAPCLCQGQGSKADYARAMSLAQRTEGTVYRQAVQPHWLPGDTRFWYKVTTGPQSIEWIEVDAEAGTRKPLVDSIRLAQALTRATGKPVNAGFLDLGQPEVTAETVSFFTLGKHWNWSRTAGTLTEDPRPEPSLAPIPAESRRARSRDGGSDTKLTFVNKLTEDVELFWVDGSGQRNAYGRVRPGQEREQHTFSGHVWAVTDRSGTSLGRFEATVEPARVVVSETLRLEAAKPKQAEGAEPQGDSGTASPDGKWSATVRDHNVVIRTKNGDTSLASTTDGNAEHSYRSDLVWSPDSRWLAVVRATRGAERRTSWIESSPRDQLQPKLYSQPYLKPGDALPKPTLRLFSVDERRWIEVSDALFSNPFTESGDLDLNWTADSRELRFIYNQRGHQVYRWLGVTPSTGAVRVIAEEAPKTFVDWTAKTYLHSMESVGEALWMSERDGWCHLWRINTRTGAVMNQITRGPWIVRQVERVDDKANQIWFFAGGIRPEQDPYYLHLCRVNFDGSDLRVLTEGDGTHKIAFSPDRRWFLDTWSRVDQPPVTELRRASDGRLVLELERADDTALRASGWTVPERFVATGRDGKTPIYGVIIRPSNLDPKRKYPVVEEIYAGPQGAFVPKEFGRLLRQHAIAELGFIVVQIDGMGTSQRSKAFHDVCWKNLADSGGPDRKAWMRTAAAGRPWMDLTRVGLYGGSAGGQNALRGLLDHGDFYSVGVADCGCHDNRMDKIWWNEQWLGWPVDEAYKKSSNVEDAAKLQGNLLLIVGEVDTNVDPASTMQVVNALEKAGKDFDLLVMTGVNHGAGETPYGSRRRMDFLVRHLLRREPRWE